MKPAQFTPANLSSERFPLLIYTCATKDYYKFVIPFIYFASYHNPQSRIEIILEDKNSFLGEYSEKLTALQDRGFNFLLTQSEFSGIRVTPNSIRFIQNPVTMAEYVYICDIDILILDNILALFLPRLAETGSFYSNIVRKNTAYKLLSGLMFIKYDCYFPVCAAQFNLTIGDEELLFKIMDEKHPGKIDMESDWRPMPGVHLSLNRRPYPDACGRPSWQVGKYGKRFIDMIRNQDFLIFSQYFDIEIRHMLIMVEYIVTGAASRLFFLSLVYGLDSSYIPQCENDRQLIHDFLAFCQNPVKRPNFANYAASLASADKSEEAAVLYKTASAFFHNRFFDLKTERLLENRVSEKEKSDNVS